MGWLAIWVCLSSLIWILAGYWEWSVPINWQVRMVSLAERKSCNPIYECFWQINPENPLAEWYIWRFRKFMPLADRKIPIRCYINPGRGQNNLFNMDTYLSCLQRRFPDIEIKLKLENLQG
ncbi:MAG: hypothetical protein PHI24_01020 [Desulfitobacteriaceae bacterium]|nr:hypothetical protein [Desulfitobacteriaceae bacterium]